jgi:hypothetical protein
MPVEEKMNVTFADNPLAQAILREGILIQDASQKNRSTPRPVKAIGKASASMRSPK